MLAASSAANAAHNWRAIRRILAAVDASVSDFASEIDVVEHPRRRS